MRLSEEGACEERATIWQCPTIERALFLSEAEASAGRRGGRTLWIREPPIEDEPEAARDSDPDHALTGQR